MIDIWQRIRAHKVVEWSLAYVAAGYALLHVAQMVSEAFDWPHVVVRAVLTLLLVGLPVAVTLAWYHGYKANHRISGPELAILSVLLVIAGAILSFVRTPERASAGFPASVPAVTAHPTPSAPITAKSVAVLPFADMSASQDQGYFADGMAEEIIDILARIPELKVIGRTSSFQFKGRGEDLRTIGEKLGAAYVVEGSVRRAGPRIRVTAQLIDTRTGTHLWADSYDRDFGDVLILQDQISTGIARALQIAAAADEARPPRQLANAEAYTYYLRGRAALDGDEAAVRQAPILLDQALALDPGFTRAAEILALAELDLLSDPAIPGSKDWSAADRAARKALALDPRSAVAHAVLGLEYATYKYDWTAARAQLDAALAADSRDAVALYLNAWLAFDLGLYDQALRLQNISVSIDPLSPDAHQNGAIIDYLMGNLDSAERSFRASMAVGPTWAGNHAYLGQIELRRGRPEAALKEILAERGGARGYALAMAYDALGRRAESDAALAEVVRTQQDGAACNIAIVYAARGDRDQAFKWLGRAVDQRELLLGHKFRNDPWLVPLRTDPRYRALLRRMNLPD